VASAAAASGSKTGLTRISNVGADARIGQSALFYFPGIFMACACSGGRISAGAFLTECAVVDRIIRHLELTFIPEKPPPAHIFEQVALMAAEESGDYE
jgi:hypothetical protein